MIHIIRTRATREQMIEMLEEISDFVKLAVDVRRGILAGGGEMHSDCEAKLLSDGSCQNDVWGAQWRPRKQQVGFESLIHIRPRQRNRGMEIEDPKLREQITSVVTGLLGEVPYE